MRAWTDSHVTSPLTALMLHRGERRGKRQLRPGQGAQSLCTVGTAGLNARLCGDGEEVAYDGGEEEAGVAPERKHRVHPLQQLSETPIPRVSARGNGERERQATDLCKVRVGHGVVLAPLPLRLRLVVRRNERLLILAGGGAGVVAVGGQLVRRKRLIGSRHRVSGHHAVLDQQGGGTRVHELANGAMDLVVLGQQGCKGAITVQHELQQASGDAIRLRPASVGETTSPRKQCNVL